jgi:hypothetical protein
MPDGVALGEFLLNMPIRGLGFAQDFVPPEEKRAIARLAVRRGSRAPSPSQTTEPVELHE